MENIAYPFFEQQLLFLSFLIFLRIKILAKANRPTINPSFRSANEIPQLASKASSAVIQQQGNIKISFFPN